MKAFYLTDDFLKIFPEAHIGVLVCTQVDNTRVDEDYSNKLLEEASKLSAVHYPLEDFSQNEVIQTWRKAYQQFKIKKGTRSSVEALLKRVKNGQTLRPINPLVDIYNAISLKYGIPAGGEDMDRFVGDLKLDVAKGGEHFVTYGSDEDEPALSGEVIYRDDEGAVVRSFNWRESVRTMLTPETTNAFMCMEQVDASRLEDLKAALTELAEYMQERLGASCEMHILNADTPRITLQK